MNSGIPYFPLDVHLDDKFELIEAEFGLTGFAVVVKLLQRIYGGQGYYCEWTNDVALLFGKKLGLGGNAVSEIVSASVKRGIFDSGLYDKYHILTSKGIQKRYFEAVSRRKKVDVKKQYLLIKVDQLYKNVNILSENVNILSENVNISKQRKEEKRKVKESRVEESNMTTAVPQELIDSYQNNITRKRVTPKELDNLEFWCERVNSDVIEWAIGEAVGHNAPMWNYIEKILENHFNAGRTTLAQVKDAQRSFRNNGAELSINNDSGLDYDELEKIMQEKM
ncbi:MAG: DUF4373 domain-containing protein [Clostridia bacterium]|nr:DUF4373 domain-containing protein [Clostridia bacterium]